MGCCRTVSPVRAEPLHGPPPGSKPQAALWHAAATPVPRKRAGPGPLTPRQRQGWQPRDSCSLHGHKEGMQEMPATAPHGPAPPRSQQPPPQTDKLFMRPSGARPKGRFPASTDSSCLQSRAEGRREQVWWHSASGGQGVSGAGQGFPNSPSSTCLLGAPLCAPEGCLLLRAAPAFGRRVGGTWRSSALGRARSFQFRSLGKSALCW